MPHITPPDSPITKHVACKLSPTSDPVNGDALDSADARGDDVLLPCLIALGPRDAVHPHVRPVDRVIGWGHMHTLVSQERSIIPNVV